MQVVGSQGSWLCSLREDFSVQALFLLVHFLQLRLLRQHVSFNHFAGRVSSGKGDLYTCKAIR